MVVLVLTDTGLTTYRPRLRDHLYVTLRAGVLDADLASGIPPETSPGHSLRADQLVRPSTRRRYARALERILGQVGASTRPGRATTVPVNHHAVTVCAQLLGQLVQTLLAPGPVTATGMATVIRLATDGTGPVYDPGTRDHRPLQAEIVACMHALRLAPGNPPPKARTYRTRGKS